jgi:hypothetical protein
MSVFEIFCGMQNIHILIKIITSEVVSQNQCINGNVLEFVSAYPKREERFKYLCWKMRFEFHGCVNVIFCHMPYADALMAPSLLLSAEQNIILACSTGKTEKVENSSFPFGR